MNADQEASNMSDETPPAEAPEETPEEAPAKRTVRRVVAAPTPAALADRRAKRLHEAQLENSRAIADQLTVWEGDEDLEVPVKVDTEFDGKLLAKYYRENGWPHCVYSRESATTAGGIILPGGKLVFSSNDTVEAKAPVEAPEPTEPAAAAPVKPAKKASKKSTKRTSSK